MTELEMLTKEFKFDDNAYIPPPDPDNMLLLLKMALSI